MACSRNWLLAGAALTSMLAAQPSRAQVSQGQSAAADGAARGETDGDIVVTAQRREETLQNTPVAVSGFTDTMLRQRGIVKLENLASNTPGLQITPVAASPNGFSISLRGALEQNGGTITSESPVAIYIDDVYQSRLSGANYDLADIARIEVLRGPQGTLYGRNSTTGAIKLITQQPDGTLWLKTDVSYASFEETKAKFSLGAPIGQNVAVAASETRDRSRSPLITTTAAPIT